MSDFNRCPSSRISKINRLRNSINWVLISIAVFMQTGCIDAISRLKNDVFIDVFVALVTERDEIEFDEVIRCEQDLNFDMGAGFWETWIRSPYAFEKEDGAGNTWRLYAPIDCDRKDLRGYPFKLIRTKPNGEIAIFILNQMPKGTVNANVVATPQQIEKSSKSRYLDYKFQAKGDPQIYSVSMRITDIPSFDKAWKSDFIQEKIAKGESYVFVASFAPREIKFDESQYVSRGIDLSFLVRDKSLWIGARKNALSTSGLNCEITYLTKEGGIWQLTSDSERSPVDATFGDPSDALVSFEGHIIPANRKIVVYDLKRQKKVQFDARDIGWFSKRWFDYDAERCQINLTAGAMRTL